MQEFKINIVLNRCFRWGEEGSLLPGFISGHIFLTLLLTERPSIDLIENGFFNQMKIILIFLLVSIHFISIQLVKGPI